jgi:hypothetical protein
MFEDEIRRMRSIQSIKEKEVKMLQAIVKEKKEEDKKNRTQKERW